LKSLVTKAVSVAYMLAANERQRGHLLPKPFEDLQGFAQRMRTSYMDAELRKLESLRSTMEAGSAEQIEVIRKLQNLKLLLKSPLLPLKN
jgi:hypothetical protein